MMRADVPLNLRPLDDRQRYMYTGDAKYASGSSSNVEAWMKRVEENGGGDSDNIGPHGKIGETMDGSGTAVTYDGAGRTGFQPTGATMIGRSNAFLVTANPKYLALPPLQRPSC